MFNWYVQLICSVDVSPFLAEIELWGGKKKYRSVYIVQIFKWKCVKKFIFVNLDKHSAFLENKEFFTSYKSCCQATPPMEKFILMQGRIQDFFRGGGKKKLKNALKIYLLNFVTFLWLGQTFQGGGGFKPSTSSWIPPTPCLVWMGPYPN